MADVVLGTTDNIFNGRDLAYSFAMLFEDMSTDKIRFKGINHG